MHHLRRFCFALACWGLLSIILAASPGLAQEREASRSWGLSASMQGGQSTLILPIWVGPQLVVAPQIGAMYIENTTTVLMPALTLRFHRGSGRFLPYWGVSGMAKITMPKGGNSDTDFSANLSYGGEFFLNPRFSFGVEGQVIASFTTPVMISTGSAVMATIYF